jgi:hypothetical protein
MMAGLEDGSSQSLDSFVGQMFGDLSDGEPDTAGPTGDAAGAPPAELPAADAATVPPEGTETSERAGTPPADAAATSAPDAKVGTPEASAPPAGPTDDPLKDATPLTYTVNGEQRTYEGIRVLGTDGAIIKPEDLPDLMRRLGERDHLYETNKAQYEATQQLERLTEWRTTDADGKESTVKGLEGLATMRVQHGKLAAAFDTLASVFKDPAKFVGLLGQDEQGKIVLDPTALQHLLTESDLAEVRAEQAIRSQLATMVRPPDASASATPDYTAHAPQMIDAAAKSVGLDGKLLGDKDRAFLAQQFPRYVRSVTDADRRANVTLKLGGPIVDAAFTELVKDRITSRQELAKLASTSTAASGRNAAVLAAATRGKPAPTAAAPAKRTPETRGKDADAGYDLMETLIGGRSRSTA